MTLHLPTAAASAGLAALLTAGAITVLDAPAATAPAPSGGASLKGIYQREALIDAQLDRVESKLDKTLANSRTTVKTLNIVYDRQGGNSIVNGTPYVLLGRIFCAVNNIPDCS